jgi:multidrug efflux pump subunit AcrB
LVRFLIARPVSVFMTVLALLIVGLITTNLIPITLLPNVAIPEITVSANNPNFTAREMQNSVTNRLVQELRQSNGIEDIKSSTTDGKMVISMKFEYGVKTNYAALEVNERIDNAMAWLPEGMERPRVIKANITDIPVFYLNLSYKQTKQKKSQDASFIELSNLAQTIFRKRFENIPEIAFVDISGTEKPQIIIKPDIQKLQSLGLDFTSIRDAFTSNNMQFGTVEVNQGQYHFNIRIETKLYTKNDVENLFIRTTSNGLKRILKLKDVAQVSIEPATRSGLFYSGKNKAISLAIIKQPQAKMVDLKTKIAQTIYLIEKKYPEINFDVAQDQTSFLDNSINNLKSSLIIGSLLAILVVFLFFANARLPLIIGISVPIALVISLLFFWLFNVTINIISLSGLMLGVGMMIDNSIIVIDNISQHWTRTGKLLDSCIKATNEVITPLLSSALTTIAVFVPLIFMSGIAGGLFTDHALSIAIGLGVSFWVAITILPVIYFRLFRNKPVATYLSQSKRPDKIARFVPLEKIYESGITFVFKYKKTTVLISLGLLLSSFILLRNTKKEIFPQFTSNDCVILVDWNESTSLLTNQKQVESLLNIFNRNTIKTNIWIGPQDYSLSKQYDLSTSQAKIYIQAPSPETIDSIKNQFRKKINQLYPKASISIEQSANIFNQVFTNNEAEVELRIFPESESFDFDSVSNIINAFSDFNTNNKKVSALSYTDYYSIELIHENILLYNLNADDITNTLRSAYGNFEIGKLNASNNSMSVMIGVPRSNIDEFTNSHVVYGGSGIYIPLNKLIKVRIKQDFRSIFSNTEGEYISLPLNSEKYTVNQLKNEINNRFKIINKPIKYKVSGIYEKKNQLLNELLYIFIIALLLLYFILASQFESLLLPFIVLIEIPINVSASLALLYITNSSLNIMSAVGLIVMSGIVINDSILKVDTINQIRKTEGLGLLDAIKEGGLRRLRPMIMTSLTTMLAIVPTFFSNSLGNELQKPFAITLIGALGLGTFVSLFLIPLLYWFIYRKAVIK